MHRKKSPERQPVTPEFWWLLLGPAVSVIWFVLYFQGEIRGASPSLQMLQLVPAVGAGWLLYSLRSRFQMVADEYHRIAASALMGAAFFAIWAVGTVAMEEFYIIFDGYEGRRIYSDDSGMGYAIGPRKALPATVVATVSGLILGVAWGIVISLCRKIRFHLGLSRGDQPE
jgi:hypothetical protein